MRSKIRHHERPEMPTPWHIWSLMMPAFRYHDARNLQKKSLQKQVYWETREGKPLAYPDSQKGMSGLLWCLSLDLMMPRKLLNWLSAYEWSSKDQHVLKITAEISSPDALGPKLKQHTQITWKAHIKFDMHDKVGRLKWGWYYTFSNIHVK